MHYLVLHTTDPDSPGTWSDEHWATLTSWLDETIRAGVNRAGYPLESPAEATTVRVRSGQLLVTDGPFAETKEQIAGYDLLECKSLDEAVSWTAKHPSSLFGPSEVRALADGSRVELPPGPVPEPDAGKTRYMLLVCTDPAADPGGLDRMEPVDSWVADLDSRGVRLFGSELALPGTARSVRVWDDQVIVTDGPFAETKEQVVGFDVLDCADLDEAIKAAARHPMARGGLLEVRPFGTLRKD
jgi:hypothetical protein